MATFTVTTTADEAYSSGDTDAEAQDGQGLSLREAVGLANATAGTHTIVFDPTIFVGAGESAMTLTLGQVTITDDLIIDGTSATDVLLTQTGGGRLIETTGTDTDLTVNNLTLTGGAATGVGATGGAISAAGTLTVIDSHLYGNSVSSPTSSFLDRSKGGAIYAAGALLIQGTMLEDSSATNGRGGAIYAGSNSLNSLTIENSTVSGNATTGANMGGGGIFARGTAEISGTSITGNSTIGASSPGGGIRGATVVITDSELRGNATNGENSAGGGLYALSASFERSAVIGNRTEGLNSDGGGIRAFSALTLINTTVAENTTSGDVSEGGGAYVSGGATLIHSTVSRNVTGGDDSDGGGIAVGSGNIALTNSILAGNAVLGTGSTGNEYSGSLSLTGANMVDVDQVQLSGFYVFGFDLDDLFETVTAVTADFDGDGVIDQTTNVLFGALGNNGGPFQTIMPLADPDADVENPLIDMATTTQTMDGRAAPRPVDITAVEGFYGNADIGAVEVQSFDPVSGPFTVTTTDDELDFTGPDATVALMGGVDDLSLREALFLANLNGTADTITFATGLTGSTIALDTDLGELTISDALTLEGDIDADGRPDITLDGQGAVRILNVTDDVTLSGLILTRGFAGTDGGGAILTDGGDLTIRNTVFSDNETEGGSGGALKVFSAQTTIANTAFVDNTARIGAAIDFSSDNALPQVITNTTFYGNAATFAGIIINNSNGLVLSQVTATGNDGNLGGSFLNNAFGKAVTIESSLIVGNTLSSGSVFQALIEDLTFAGTNVLEQTGIGGTNDITGVTGEEVFFSTETVNGVTTGTLTAVEGRIPTVALRRDGPAVDAGDTAELPLDVTDVDRDGDTAETLPLDARGLARVVGDAVDVGAYELGEPLLVTTNEDERWSGGDLQAETLDGEGLSLREAIELINRDLATVSEIAFATALSGEAIALGSLGEGTTQLTISDDMVIYGLGDDLFTITTATSAANDDLARLFLVEDGVNFALSGVSLTGGATDHSTGEGGAILAGAGSALTLDDVTIADNDAGQSSGGGIFSLGTVVLTDSAVTGNTAGGTTGGGVHVVDDFTMTGSTISGNALSAPDGSTAVGGGAYLGGGTALIVNSTVDGNAISADSGTLSAAAGGGLATSGVGSGGAELTLYNSTISDNTIEARTVAGGGLFGGGDFVNLTLAGNTATGFDVYGEGGGAFINQDSSFLQSTITGNAVFGAGLAYAGGGLHSTGDITVSLGNSIIAGNRDAARGQRDIQAVNGATIESDGGNVISEISSSLAALGATGNTVVTDLSTVFASLTTISGTLSIDGVVGGTLADNGGPVETVLLAEGGAAIDVGDAAKLAIGDPLDLDGDGNRSEDLPVDARGLRRAIDGSTGASVGAPDPGALEFTPEAPLVVTTTADEAADGVPLDFAGEATDGDGLSLREALALAALRDTPQTITFDTTGAFADGGVISLDQSLGHLLVSSTVEIDGGTTVIIDANADGDGNAATSVVDGAALSTAGRGIYVTAAGNALLRGLTITGGYTTANGESGGGVSAATGSTLALVNSTVSNSGTAGGAARGGGIYGDTVTLVNVTVSGNETNADSAWGGGIRAGDLTAVNVTVADNTTSGDISGSGGGIWAGDLILINSTVTDNQTLGTIFNDGGGVFVSGTADIQNSIILGNDIDTTENNIGEEISLTPADVTFKGLNIIGPDGSGSFDFSDQDAVEEDAAAIVFAETTTNGSQTAGLIADNGGPVETALLNIDATNPALDAGMRLPSESDIGVDVDGDGSLSTTPIGTDARGITRPVDLTGNADAVDLGAVELRTTSIPSGPFVVTTADDELDAEGPDVTLALMGGADDLSLREAIYLANLNGGADTITFDSTVFIGGEASVIRLTQGEIEITEAVTIDGSDATDLVISGDALANDGQLTTGVTDLSTSTSTQLEDNTRLLKITSSSADTTLSNLTLTGGRTFGDSRLSRLENPYSGGAVYTVSGELVLRDVVLAGNSTAGSFAFGGAIFSQRASGASDRSEVRIYDSVISGNRTEGDGAAGGAVATGFFLNGLGTAGLSDLAIYNSVVTDNETQGRQSDGGALHATGNAYAGGTHFEDNRTLEFRSFGGALHSFGDAEVVDSVFRGNWTLGDFGGGGAVSAIDVSVAGSIFAGNWTAGDSSSGGAIRAGFDIDISNSTITGNTVSGSSSNGGGVATTTANGGVSLRNSILSGNAEYEAGFDDDFVDFITVLNNGEPSLVGNNIVGVSSSVSVDGAVSAASSDVFSATIEVYFDTDADGVLDTASGVFAGDFSDNGGPFETIRLLPDVSNPAIDGGVDAVESNLADRTDIRGTGFVRAFDILSVKDETDNTIDLGALELQQGTDASLASTIVTTNEDVVDPFDGVISLREAVLAINRGISNSGTTITFDETVFTGGDSSALTLTQGEIEITSALAIDASDIDGLTISGDVEGNDILDGNGWTDVLASGYQPLRDNTRLFNITDTDADTTLIGLTLTGGRSVVPLPRISTSGTIKVYDGAPYSGGAIRSAADRLVIQDSVIAGNSTSGDGAMGGAIYTVGESAGVRMYDSLVHANGTFGYYAGGGAIATYAASGRPDRFAGYNVSLTDNFTRGDYSPGGAIYGLRGAGLYGGLAVGNHTLGDNSPGGAIYGGQSADVEDASLVENFTAGNNSPGGALVSRLRTSLYNSTVTDNTTAGSGSPGGGLYMEGGSGNNGLRIGNSIILGNATGNDSVADEEVSIKRFGIVRDANIIGADSTAFDIDAQNYNDPDAALQIQNADPALVFADTELVLYDDDGDGERETSSGSQGSALADNGGDFLTVALAVSADNPAIDASLPTSLPGTNDVRGEGFLREVDFFGVANAGDGILDIGAFELNYADGAPIQAEVEVDEESTDTVYTAVGEADSFVLTGPDSALFTLDSETGTLEFLSPPDFEAPGDANADNTYDVTILAVTGSAVQVQGVEVVVQNVNDAPVFSGLDATPTYEEDGDGVVLDADATIADEDLDAANSGDGNFAGATLTLVRAGGAVSTDLFGFSFGPTSTVSLVGSNFVVGGVTVATLSQSGGSATVSFTDANGTIPTTGVANAILQTATYASSASTLTLFESGSASVAFTFDDGAGAANSAVTGTMDVLITPSTAASGAVVLTADQDSYQLDGTSALVIAAPDGVLANDTGPGAPFEVLSTTDPSQGSVAVNPDGSFAFTPDDDFFLSDTFDYTFTNGSEQATGTVTILGDIDQDGVADTQDNAIFVVNPLQTDTDGDNYGNVIDADFDQDLDVDFLDFSSFAAGFGGADLRFDLTEDGTVDFLDFSRFAALDGTSLSGQSFIDYPNV